MYKNLILDEQFVNYKFSKFNERSGVERVPRKMLTYYNSAHQILNTSN
jgi:hypothetical protein